MIATSFKVTRFRSLIKNAIPIKQQIIIIIMMKIKMRSMKMNNKIRFKL